MTRAYKIVSEETWAEVRACYLSGWTAKACAERFGVTEHALRRRATREGWSKKAHAEARRAGGEDAAGEGTATRGGPLADHPVAIAETALRTAVEALAQGRAADAQALIKAGNAVGEFAEFVRELRESGRLGAG